MSIVMAPAGGSTRLSYACCPILVDDAHLSDVILCNDQPLMATAHLNQGLKRYRANRSKWQFQPCKLLWVDAIFIHQRNNVEKSSHVHDMDEIYHNAQRTVIWLENPDSLKAGPKLEQAFSTARVVYRYGHLSA